MVICMKTTLNLNDAILKAAKRRAIEENLTLTRVLEDALHQYLRPPVPRGRFRLRILTRKGDLVPGVDLEDRDSLYDRMEGIR